MCEIPNDSWFYIAINDFPSFAVTTRRLVAIAILIFCSYFRRTGLAGHSNWTRAHQPIGPSLTGSPAPMTTARIGVTGCATWIISWFFFAPLLVVAIDLFIVQGRFLCENSRNIFNFLLDLAGGGLTLFKQLAIAILA